MVDEGRKFFRYVLPGLVFFIELFLFAWIVMPFQTICFVEGHFNDIGTAATILLTSGGLGFIFASIHHALSWCVPRYSNIVDQREVLVKLLNNGLIEIKELEEVGISEDKENQQDRYSVKRSCNRKEKMKAYVESQSHWFRLIKLEQMAEPAIGNFGHQAQGLGTAAVASLFALVLAFLLPHIFRTPQADSCHVLVVVFVGVALTLMFYCQFRRMGKFMLDTYTIALVNAAKFHRHQIREAAYLRAAQRNFQPGHEREDWLAAEAEINMK